MSYCSNCGSKLPNGALFCPSCGKKLSEPNTSRTTQNSLMDNPIGDYRVDIPVGSAIRIPSLCPICSSSLNLTTITKDITIAHNMAPAPFSTKRFTYTNSSYSLHFSICQNHRNLFNSYVKIKRKSGMTLMGSIATLFGTDVQSKEACLSFLFKNKLYADKFAELNDEIIQD